MLNTLIKNFQMYLRPPNRLLHNRFSISAFIPANSGRYAVYSRCHRRHSHCLAMIAAIAVGARYAPMKLPPQFQHLIVETFTRLGGRLLALVLLIWLVVLLINVSMTLTHAGVATAMR
jgi:hypothetical protein